MVLLFGEEAIGKLKSVKIGEIWVAGKFCAFDSFGKFRKLFDALETAWVCEAENYFALQAESDALGLRVETGEETFNISDFKIVKGHFEFKIKH